VKQTMLLRFILGALVGIAAFAGGMLGQAYAHPTARYLQQATTIRIKNELVLGHHVRVCKWRPGDRRVRGIVRYSKLAKTVPGWAGAGRRLSRASCALNGGTYQTAAGAYQWRPSGTVYATGRRVRHVMDAPAVGFVGGHVYFGARHAYRRGSREIVNQLAYLVRKGVPLRSHSEAPWTTSAQFWCGAPGTDGVYGCSRSVVAQWSNGRVGLVEIGHASMPLAARILRAMGVVNASTGDSGGAALMWTLLGTHNTGSRTQVGHLFGATVGSAWKRHIVDAIIVNARRA